MDLFLGFLGSRVNITNDLFKGRNGLGKVSIMTFDLLGEKRLRREKRKEKGKERKNTLFTKVEMESLNPLEILAKRSTE